MVDTPAPGGYPDRMDAAYAKRALAVEPFLAMEVMERALALEREGAPVFHLEIGEPEAPPPRPSAVR